MEKVSTLRVIAEIPCLIAKQAARPVRVALRQPQTQPKTQQALSRLVEESLTHEIRAGYKHRFIPLMFVTVGERIFCRRYSFNEPSWHGAFHSDPAGQIKLDKTVINIEGRAPEDLDEVLPSVDQAYANALKKLGASFLRAGATERRAQTSTIEITLAQK